MRYLLFIIFLILNSCVTVPIDNKDNSNALLILREMQIKFTGTADLEKIDRRIKQLST